MLDRCAGDVGDFLKLGLLRWLVAPSPFGRSHRLGVVWCRESDGNPGLDGQRVGHLDPQSAAGEDLRALDSDLYDRLRGMLAAGDRSASSLAASGALPQDTLYFDHVLSFSDLARADRAARIVRRERWFHEAMVALEPCSLVFVDPDNGLSRDDLPARSHQNLAEKHAYMSEVGRLLERGQSVVVHDDADCSEPVAATVASKMGDIHNALCVEPLAVLPMVRGANRLFLVIPHQRHRSELEHRLGALQLSRWGDEFRLYRWSREKVLT